MNDSKKEHLKSLHDFVEILEERVDKDLNPKERGLSGDIKILPESENLKLRVEALEKQVILLRKDLEETKKRFRDCNGSETSSNEFEMT